MFSIVLTQYDGMILGPIAKVFGVLLDFIYSLFAQVGIENVGLCIIAFTVIVNIIMIPLTIKQQKFSKLSSIMNPEIQEIQKKYKGKKDEASMRKQQEETQAVYNKYGANPASGCLPTFITLPIMLALYRVIYNVPAYVSSIKGLYENIAIKMTDTDYVGVMTKYAEGFKRLSTKNWTEFPKSISTDHLIDIMTQFNSSHWSELVNNSHFSSIKDVIQTNSDKIMHINNFGFGINIAETPWTQIISNPSVMTKVMYILIPVIAVVAQMLSAKLMSNTQPQLDENNPMASQMKTMNIMMPLMSGGFCLMLPVGVGIYLITQSVFRVVQQVIVNKYMDTIDIQEVIDKNKEKAAAKAAKRSAAIEKYQNSSNGNDSIRSRSNVKTSNVKDVNNSNRTYKKGGIADYANMLNNKDKGED